MKIKGNIWASFIKGVMRPICHHIISIFCSGASPEILNRLEWIERQRIEVLFKSKYFLRKQGSWIYKKITKELVDNIELATCNSADKSTICEYLCLFQVLLDDLLNRVNE